MDRPAPDAAEPDPHADVIPILDFGSQYAQLIARRVREAGAFSTLQAPDTPVRTLRELKPRGIILSGGPASVTERSAIRCAPDLFEVGVPVLGICYGMQLACQLLGCHVNETREAEYGRARLTIHDHRDLLADIPSNTTVWMSHGDQVTGLSEQFDMLASTPTCPFAAVRHKELPFYGVQFHPEVTHTPHGGDLLRNFLYEICKCTGTWRMADFVESECRRIKRQVGDGRVVCGLSGGVDSSVVAALLARAIGDRLSCIFVDNGLLRKNERRRVESTFRDHFEIDLRVIDAAAEFLGDLENVTDPQEKRTRIGHRFIEVFKRAAGEIG
ncbi:MAG: glutamine-hydrolyzing GMP synthase, partial [Planctomycetota bacterium]